MTRARDAAGPSDGDGAGSREGAAPIFLKGDYMLTTRRQFLKATTAGALLAGLPARWAGGAYASDGPETPKMRFGIIALTDCSTIVMAHELGLFKKHGIESTISKEASWAVIRDRLALGENQGTHLLLGIPYASTMGSRARP